MLRTAVVLSLAALLLAVPAAEAKAPPLCKYDCTVGSGILFGTVSIKADGRHTHRGTKGTFTTGAKRVTFPAKVSGYRVSFKGGSLAGIKGRWYKASDGTPAGTFEIALKNPRDDFKSIYCSKNE